MKKMAMVLKRPSLFFPAVGEDSDRCRDLLDRPERSGDGGRLGVERRHPLRRIFVVCEPKLKTEWKKANVYTRV